MSAPHLLHFRISHYNEKVRWALDYKRWPHTREAFVPGLHVAPVRLRSGQQQLPVLVLDGETLIGSSRILSEIERRRPDPPLFPRDLGELERALAIQAFFDEEVAPDLRRLFWSTYVDHRVECVRMAADGASSAARALLSATFPLVRPLFRRNLGLDRASLDRARARMRGYFDRLESEIGPSGYLVGDAFGVADLTAAAVMTAILRPPQFPYPLPEPWPEGLRALRASVEDHAACKWVMDIYARHRSPSAEVAK